MGYYIRVCNCEDNKFDLQRVTSNPLFGGDDADNDHHHGDVNDDVTLCAISMLHHTADKCLLLLQNCGEF